MIEPKQSLREKTPAISVVVPVRDEESSIATLLDGLLGQTLPPDEIVITDGGSVDSTREIIEDYIARGARVKLVRDRDSMPGRSRNLGVANAKNDWIAFIDADIKPNPDWLQALFDKADGSKADVVYGTYDPIIDSFFKECAAIAYVPVPLKIDDGWVRAPSIASALMRRDVWQSVGGFPETLRSAEDLLFMRNIEQANFKIARSGHAVVRWNIQPTLWRTFRRFVEYSRNNIRAGLFTEWQGRIFIYYAGLSAVSILSALYFGARGLLVPPFLWLLFLILRAMRTLRRNRESLGAGVARNFARLMMLMPILATLDIATFAGSLKWLFVDKLGTSGRKEVR